VRRQTRQGVKSFGRELGITKNFGSNVGANLGRMAGNMISGYGDYEVRSNTLVNPVSVPDFGTQSVRITHKEYLGNIHGSVSFAHQEYPLNPGLSVTFPWLSGIARNYQQYRLNGVIFQYVSTSAFALGTTNSALGKVMIATNYNAEDDPFTGTVGMLATQFSNYCRPADSIMHAIECAPTEVPSNVYYIRTDLDGQQKDKRLTDLGFTQIGTEGMQATTEVGGLWISYDVTLMKPILNPSNAISDGFDQFVCQTLLPINWYEFKPTPRNNYLQGQLSQFGTMPAALYTFGPTISSGTFLVIWEFQIPATSTFSDVSGGGYGNLSNAVYVTDDDKNGPFNNAYGPTVTAPTFASNSLQEGKVTGTEAIIMYMVSVTGPDASLSLTNLALSGTLPITFRLSVIPISYKNSPQVEGP